MKIAILGSKGQLGSDILKVLKNSTHNVKAFDRNTLNLENSEKIPEILSAFLPFDILINCVAMTNTGFCEKNHKDSFKINSLPLLQISNFCQSNNITLYHISTDYVFDGQKSEPYEEVDRTNPINVYGLSKLSGENIIKSSLEKYFIFRTSSLFGIQGASGKGGNFVESMITKYKNKDPIKVVSDQYMSPTHTLELARCLAHFIEQNITDYGIYHFSNDGHCSWFEFAKEIFNQLSIDINITPVSYKDFPSVLKRPSNSTLSGKKIKAYFSPRPWQESLNEYLNLKGHL